jgi:hypothetical protein
VSCGITDTIRPASFHDASLRALAFAFGWLRASMTIICTSWSLANGGALVWRLLLSNLAARPRR